MPNVDDCDLQNPTVLAGDVERGYDFRLHHPGDLDAPGPFSVVDERGELLAVYERRGGGVKPTVVLAPQASA